MGACQGLAKRWMYGHSRRNTKPFFASYSHFAFGKNRVSVILFLSSFALPVTPRLPLLLGRQCHTLA